MRGLELADDLGKPGVYPPTPHLRLGCVVRLPGNARVLGRFSHRVSVDRRCH